MSNYNIHPLIRKFYPESNFLGYTFVDGSVAFYNSVNYHVTQKGGDKTLLDLGCGRGAYMDDLSLKVYTSSLQNFKGRVKKVIGIDIDANASCNPSIDEFRLIQIDKKWPIEENSIDICICDWVIEHVENTDFFFSELNRVMKKGGVVCFRTTNKFGYISFFSRLIPNKIHTKILNKIQPFRKEEDVFPTVYKCNTKKSFIQHLKKHGFTSSVYHHISEPSYLTFSYLSFAFGYYLHKLIPTRYKTTIFAFGIKS